MMASENVVAYAPPFDGGGGGGAAGSTKAEVRFEFVDAAGSPDVPLPVTVRHFSTRIAAQGVTGQPLRLDPGDYLVTIERADGTTVSQSAKVETSPSTSKIKIIDLDEPDLETGFEKATKRRTPGSGVESATIGSDAFPGSVFESAVGAQSQFTNSSLENISASFARQYRSSPSTRASYVPWTENVASSITAREVWATRDGRFRIAPNAVNTLAPDAMREGLYSIAVQGQAQPGRFIVVELPRAKVRRIAVSVPAAEYSSVELMVAVDPLRIVPILQNAKANALLSYMTEQSYAQVASYTAAQSAGDLENLLYSKMADPIGAAIGGYGLLSLNRFSPLETWSENLTRVAPWLADGFAIHGETQARLGHHAKAAKFFLEMTRVGLPVFSVGLSYAETRVRLYIQHKLPDAAAADELAAWLKEISHNVLPRLLLGEVLTSVADPEVVLS